MRVHERASWCFRGRLRRLVRTVAAFCFLATCRAAASKFARHLLPASQGTGLRLSLGRERYLETQVIGLRMNSCFRTYICVHILCCIRRPRSGALTRKSSSYIYLRACHARERALRDASLLLPPLVCMYDELGGDGIIKLRSEQVCMHR